MAKYGMPAKKDGSILKVSSRSENIAPSPQISSSQTDYWTQVEQPELHRVVAIYFDVHM